jgi:ABC-type methionine transport system permease subunit
MVVSISSIDTIDLFSAILSAVGGGGIGAIVADSRLGSSRNVFLTIRTLVYVITFVFCHHFYLNVCVCVHKY